MTLIRNEKFRQDKFVFDISYVSQPGGRTVNEDSLAIKQTGENVLLSVADGLGAHGGGDIASSVATDIATEEYMKLTRPKRINIFNIFQAVNDAIVEKQTDELKMKTTLACVLCRCKWIYAAHLGDTRIYTFKDNKETYITADHSFAYSEVMKNHGTLDDIRKNPNRHVLNAALGVRTMRSPDIFRQKIRDNLSVLICSDGFWEYVNEDEMLKALANTSTVDEWLSAMLKIHSQKATVYNDNYSAICLKIIKIKGGKNLCNSRI